MFEHDGPGAVTTTLQAMNTRLPLSDRQRRRAAIRFWILAPLQAIAWGWAAFELAPQYFSMLTPNGWGANSNWNEASTDVSSFMWIPISITLAAFLGFATFSAGMKAFGTFLLGNFAAHAWSLSGIGVGSGLALVGGSQAGTQPTPWEAQANGTDLWSWIQPNIPWLVAVVFLLVGIVNGILFAVLHARARHAARAAARLRSHGVHVHGRIVQVDFTNTWLMGLPQFRVVVEYDGPHGRRRTEQSLATAATMAPNVGGAADVWVDRHNPNDVAVEVHPMPGWPPDPRLFMPHSH